MGSTTWGGLGAIGKALHWSKVRGFFSKGVSQEASEAAARLGIDLNDVNIANGIAHTTVNLSTTLKPTDMRLLKEALKTQGANSARIETGNLANTKLDSFLQDRISKGRTFYGGTIQRSNTPGSDYVITIDLK